MQRQHSFLIAVVGLLVVFAAVTTARGWAAGPAPTQLGQPVSMPESVAEMQHHFLQVTSIHEALIRGDLPALKASAMELARMQLPVGNVAGAGPFVEALKAAARRAAEATDLASAASATALMLRQCGACHLTVVRPAIATTSRRETDGVVGHMRQHQRAVDDLLQGLVVPSAFLWSRGAEGLRAVPLQFGELPRDPGLTESITRADARIHVVADRAVGARDPIARGAAYAELLTTCAECHSLHSRAWGPTSSRAPGAGS